MIVQPVPATEIADVIDVAVEHLECNRWGQGEHRRVEQAICGGDAVWMAVFGAKSVGEYYVLPFAMTISSRRLGVAVCTAILHYVNGKAWGEEYLWRWNDAPGRTKQEVIDAFKETAKELRNQAVPSVIF